ncbi:MAG: hypothetical protein ACI3X1_01635 [Eubacteriales bacterium]
MAIKSVSIRIEEEMLEKIGSAKRMDLRPSLNIAGRNLCRFSFFLF